MNDGNSTVTGNQAPRLSRRRLKSLLRAEDVARELRFQFTTPGAYNTKRLTDLLVRWMDVTGKQKWERPDA